jgi:hypothetical protein
MLMKYVNPDSTHTLNAPDLDAEPSHPASQSRPGLRPLALGALAVGAGAVAFMAAWRVAIRSLTVKSLKVERLEVTDLHIVNHQRANSSMEESGGILRFELGSSDVYENGLE